VGDQLRVKPEGDGRVTLTRIDVPPKT